MSKLLVILLLCTVSVRAATTVGGVLVATDTTGTNARPSSVFVVTGTNAALTGNLTANGGAFTNSLTLNGVAVSTASGANPSASVDVSVVNGAATTFMRSDAAPALSQAITPTWTGLHTWGRTNVFLRVQDPWTNAFWNMGVRGFTNNDAGHFDDVFAIGYNLLPGGRESAIDLATGLKFENYYNIAGTHQVETYFVYNPTNGVEFRPISYVGDVHLATVGVHLAADVTYLENASASTIIGSFAPNGSGANDGGQLTMRGSIVLQKNNLGAPVLELDNSSGTPIGILQAQGTQMVLWAFGGATNFWIRGFKNLLFDAGDSTSPELKANGTTLEVKLADDSAFTGLKAGTVTITPPANTTAQTVNGISVTGSGATTGIDWSGTWNTSGSPYFHTVNITNTASGSAAGFVDYKLGGVSKFQIDKNGTINNATGANFTGNVRANNAFVINGVTLLESDGTGILKLWDDQATTQATEIKAGNGSGTDKDGSSLSIEGGQSTGTGRGGPVIGRTSPSGTTSSTKNAYSERYHYPAKAVTLTESSATTVATIACASGKFVGGQCVVTVNADDGTDFQCRTLRFTVSAVNKGGTVTAGIDTPSEAVAASTGTLTATITAVANGNAVDLKVNATSSLTQTTLNATVALPTLNSNGTAAVTEI